MTTDVLVEAGELERRTVRRTDWVSCNAAFIDCRTPGSDRKEDDAFIGSGVSQNADQFVNLTETPRLNLGAAGMPNGVTQQPPPALHGRGLHQLRRHLSGALGGGWEAGGVPLARR